MDRMEFMRELEARLSDIPENERREALQYYEDYLNDAGVENEQGAMEQLGTPEKIAENLKAGLTGSDAGEFTENGYQNGNAQNRPPAMRTANPYSGKEQAKPEEKKETNRVLKFILVALLCIFLAPVILPIGAAMLGLLIAGICAILAIWFSLWIVGLVGVLAGGVVFFAGIIRMFTMPLAGAVLLGTGLLVFGISMLLFIITSWLAVKLIPVIIRGMVNLLQRPFRKKAA